MIENTRIPTYSDCVNLVESNVAFIKKIDVVNDIPVASFKYKLASYGDFISTPFARNMRGITFREDTEELLALPYFKFFNYNENPLTESSKVDKWNINKIRDKLDGSLVYYYQLDGEVMAKTTMSCESSMAVATLSMTDIEHISTFVEAGITPMVEYTSPDNHIIVPYQTTRLTMLGMRDMHTGEVYDYDRGVYPLPDEYSDGMHSTSDIIRFCSTYETIDREGFVVTFQNGEMAKFKTDRYRAMHKLKDSLSYSTIAELTLMEGLDDMISLFYNDPVALNRINTVSAEVRDTWNTLCSQAESFYNDTYTKERKEYALSALDRFGKESLQFGYAMNLYNGKDNMDKLKQSFLMHLKEQDN